MKTVAVQPCNDSEEGEMTDILNADEQRRLHKENQDAIRSITTSIDELIRRQGKMETALVHGLGIDINDPKTVRKFAEEHADLVDQKTALVNLQLKVGKTILWICAGVFAYLATSFVDSGILRAIINLGPK